MNNLINYINNKFCKKKKNPVFKTGDDITVSYEIIEGEKKRIQSFRGIVLQCKGKKYLTTFTIRKISQNIGVERTFLFNQPSIKKIKINKLGKTRRAKIFFFRNLKGKKSRI